MKLFLFGLVVSLVASLGATSVSPARHSCAGPHTLGGARVPFKPKPGGLFPVNLEKEDRSQFDAAARKAVELMNTASKGKKIELVELLSAQFAIIAGTMYDLELSVTIDGQPAVCFVYTAWLYPWAKNGGIWSVRAQCPDDPCAAFKAGK